MGEEARTRYLCKGHHGDESELPISDAVSLFAEHCLRKDGHSKPCHSLHSMVKRSVDDSFANTSKLRVSSCKQKMNSENAQKGVDADQCHMHSVDCIRVFDEELFDEHRKQRNIHRHECRECFANQSIDGKDVDYNSPVSFHNTPNARISPLAGIVSGDGVINLPQLNAPDDHLDKDEYRIEYHTMQQDEHHEDKSEE